MSYWLKHKHFINLSFQQLVKLINFLKLSTACEVKVKFLSCLDVKFPRGEISSVTVKESPSGEIIVEVATRVFALLGTSGVLPWHYSDYILASNRVKDTGLLDLINLFYNKLLQVFTRIITKHSIYLEYDKYITSQGEKPPQIWLALSSLIGVPPGILAINIPNVLVNYAGLLINSSHSASALQSILSCYLQLDIEIEEFVSEKLKLEEKELSRLGRNNSHIRSSFYLGHHIYFNQHKIIVKVYNLSFKTYDQFLTISTNRKKELMQILDFYLAKHLKYQLVFLLIESEKFTPLSSKQPRKLGLSMWCKR